MAQLPWSDSINIHVNKGANDQLATFKTLSFDTIWLHHSAHLGGRDPGIYEFLDA